MILSLHPSPKFACIRYSELFLSSHTVTSKFACIRYSEFLVSPQTVTLLYVTFL
jgi:hypothetical protein